MLNLLVLHALPTVHCRLRPHPLQALLRPLDLHGHGLTVAQHLVHEGVEDVVGLEGDIGLEEGVDDEEGLDDFDGCALVGCEDLKMLADGGLTHDEFAGIVSIGLVADGVGVGEEAHLFEGVVGLPVVFGNVVFEH